MKRTIYIVMAVLLVGLVSAGSIEDLNYKDRVGFWDTKRQVDDFDVTIDADTVQGVDVVDELSVLENDINKVNKVNKKQNKKINNNKEDINSLDDYISSHEESWGIDTSGWSKSKVMRYLTGDFIDLLKTIFVTREELEASHDRMDLIEAKIDLGKDASMTELKLQAAKIKSERIDKQVSINGYTCNWKVCFKTN